MKQLAKTVAVVYFVAMAIFVTFPGLRVANRIEPYVFGLPFVFAWFMGWMLGALAVFYLLYRAYDRD